MVAKGWKSNLTTSSAQGLGHDWMSLGEGPVTIYALPDDAVLARYCFVSLGHAVYFQNHEPKCTFFIIYIK